MKTLTESKRETNSENNAKLINELADFITKIDPNNKPNIIVKSIDKLVQEYYLKLYDSIDQKKIMSQEKHGHCC